jgi:paraquat-inducible protein B
MSDSDKPDKRDNDKEKTPENPPEEAVFRPSRWPGLIWAVPIAALAIIAWLGISALL